MLPPASNFYTLEDSFGCQTTHTFVCSKSHDHNLDNSKIVIKIIGINLLLNYKSKDSHKIHHTYHLFQKISNVFNGVDSFAIP